MKLPSRTRVYRHDDGDRHMVAILYRKHVDYYDTKSGWSEAYHRHNFNSFEEYLKEIDMIEGSGFRRVHEEVT